MPKSQKALQTSSGALDCICKATVVIEKCKLSEGTLLRVQRDLLLHNWADINCLSVDDGYEYLINVITETLDIHAPKKLIKLKSCDKFREPWMNVRLKRYNAKCHKLCNKARLSGKEIDHVKYKLYCNTLRRVKAYEKKCYYEDLFKRIGKNSQLLWDVVNNIVQKCHNRCSITEIFHKDRKINDPSEICNAFNDHFATAGARTQSTIIRKTNMDPLSSIKRVTNCLLFSPVSEQYVCKIVMSLKPKRSSGYDDISNALLQQIINVIKTLLCMIFNKSLLNGEFPDLMKIAKVVPLHKGGASNLPDNYRPISLLPVISKVLECIVYNFMIEHLESNGILYTSIRI